MLLVVAVIALLLILQTKNTATIEKKNTLLNNQASLSVEEIQESAEMTFVVTVPKNTPKNDIIYIYFPNETEFQLERQEDGTHSRTFTQSEVPLEQYKDELQAKYRYGRNGTDFITAEYLEPDTNDYFWTTLGRHAPWVPGETVEDVVTRWRWLPAPEQKPETQLRLALDTKFEPRIDEKTFYSGQAIQDLYMKGFEDFFTSTAEHMADQGYNSVTITPPWDWVETSPPAVGNPVEKNPNYTDEQLRNELKALKAAGLSIQMGPQVCCTELETRDQTKEWWDSYFKGIEEMLVHHAIIAQEEGVDSLFYAFGDQFDIEVYTPEEVEQRWRSIIQAVRDNFKGEIHQMLWVNSTGLAMTAFPDTTLLPWINELDGIVLHVDAPISTAPNPTDEELQEGAKEITDLAEQLYKDTGKTTSLLTVYAAVKQTWEGNELYSIEVMNAPWGGEDEWQKGRLAFSGNDQARVLHAFMQEVANAPHITGAANFGYWHWDMPLSPDMSVRGKPAEAILNQWNKKIFN